MCIRDSIKGILTNLLENAAEAAGEGGKILGVTAEQNGRVAIEVHDSGPGLSEQARASLFQPTISFKKQMCIRDRRVTARPYFPLQHGARFPRNAPIPSCASAAMAFSDITSLA